MRRNAKFQFQSKIFIKVLKLGNRSNIVWKQINDFPGLFPFFIHKSVELIYRRDCEQPQRPTANLDRRSISIYFMSDTFANALLFINGRLWSTWHFNSGCFTWCTAIAQPSPLKRKKDRYRATGFLRLRLLRDVMILWFKIKYDCHLLSSIHVNFELNFRSLTFKFSMQICSPLFL